MYRICYRSPVPQQSTGLTRAAAGVGPSVGQVPGPASLTGTGQSRPANVSSADGQHKWLRKHLYRAETEGPGDDVSRTSSMLT